MARVVAMIPARLESTRFFGKVLHPVRGKPLIYYVWKAACDAKTVNRVFVVTDSPDVGRAVNAFGGAVIMTSSRPRNGTERVAEAVADLPADIIINIQADNLGLTGATLDRIIKQMARDKSIAVATLARRIDGRGWKEKLYHPDVVKVVADRAGNAAWFSRYPIPYIRGLKGGRAIDRFSFLEHIGVYVFRREALLAYARRPRGRAEQAESLEQLRILENGEKIKLFITRTNIVSIDTREALRTIKTILR
jgi:3-deoxy-manno-octulosonate cytidylyltransferase (CMP-KDO synthetase)